MPTIVNAKLGPEIYCFGKCGRLQGWGTSKDPIFCTKCGDDPTKNVPPVPKRSQMLENLESLEKRVQETNDTKQAILEFIAFEKAKHGYTT